MIRFRLFLKEKFRTTLEIMQKIYYLSTFRQRLIAEDDGDSSLKLNYPSFLLINYLNFQSHYIKTIILVWSIDQRKHVNGFS